MTNQKIAEKLLEVLGNNEVRGPRWALVEVLQELRNQLSGTNENVNWRDECNVSYVNGWDDCLKDISAICDELESL